MCFLIVKKFDDIGSIAIELSDSKEVSGLSKFLNSRLKGTDKQVVTISDLDTWQEYAPFTKIKSVGDFINKAEKM